MNKKLDFIDALRGYAILSVIVVHVSYTESIKLSVELKNLLGQGARGVQLFFIVSALTLFMSFEKRVINENSPIRNFFIRRFFRIAPMYYLAIIYYYFQNNLENEGINGLVLNFFFLHGLSPHFINNNVPGGWSIGVEMMFYIVLPILFYKIKNLNEALVFLLITVFFKGIMELVIRYFYSNEIPLEMEYFLFFYLPSQLPIFSLGIILYFILKVKSISDLVISKSSLILLSLLLLFYFYTKNGYLINENILVGMIFILISFALSTSKSFFINKYIRFIGKISFSLYLVHFAVIHWLNKFYFFLYFNIGLIDYFYRLALVIFFGVLISSMFYYLIELPFQKIAKKLIIKINN